MHLSELQITGLAPCFQSTGTSSQLVLAQCLHLLLVFDGVGSFPVTFSKNSSKWITILFPLQINDCKSSLFCPSTFSGPGGLLVCRSLCSTEWALFCRNQSEGLLLLDGHANYLPPCIMFSTASQYFLQLGRMVITRRGYIWGLKSTHPPPPDQMFSFLLTFFPFEYADFQAFLHRPEGWLHLRFLCDHVSPGTGVLRKTTNTVRVMRAGADIGLDLFPVKLI